MLFLLFLWIFYIFANFYLIFIIIFCPDEIGCWQR